MLRFDFCIFAILALLDYVSRAHETEICPSSVLCRPFVSQLYLNLMRGFLSNLSFYLPWAIRSPFDFLKNKFRFFFRFKTLIRLQITVDGLKLLNFLQQDPPKNTFGIFEILKIEIIMIFFFVFVNMRPKGSENFKMLPLLQIAGRTFQNGAEFSSQWPS